MSPTVSRGPGSVPEQLATPVAPAPAPGAAPSTAPSTAPSAAPRAALRRAGDPLPRRLTTLAVVVPMYRESSRIAATLDTLSRSTLNREGVQLILVDDGSDDDTVGAVYRALPATTLHEPLVIRLPQNQGKGAAVRAGVLAADADVVAFVDADLSMDPYVLDLGLQLMRSSGADVVLGRRVVDRSEQPVLRRLCSLTFRRAVAVLAPTGASDPQCACKLFSRDAARWLFEPLSTSGFAFDVEVLLRARHHALQVEELPVAWTHQPGSTVNPLVEPLRMVRDVVKARRAIRRAR